MKSAIGFRKHDWQVANEQRGGQCFVPGKGWLYFKCRYCETVIAPCALNYSSLTGELRRLGIPENCNECLVEIVMAE